MKAQTKRLIMLFFICLIIVPAVIYASGNKQSLKRITVVPEELTIPSGTTEEQFKSLLQVTAIYRDGEDKVVTDFTTDFNEVKDRIGSYKVKITYNEDGCVQKAKVCTELIKEPPLKDSDFPYISGYEDKTFRPNQAVTREELAAMLARLLTKNDVPKLPNSYPDLNPNRYSTDSINYMTKLGVFAPQIDGKFGAADPITIAEFKDILQKLSPYIDTSKLVLPHETGDLSRTEAVVLLNELFQRDCSKIKDVPSPYTDLKEDDPYYKAIICASVK